MKGNKAWFLESEWKNEHMACDYVVRRIKTSETSNRKKDVRVWKKEKVNSGVIKNNQKTGSKRSSRTLTSLLLPHGWSGLWWAGIPAWGHTDRRGRYRSSSPSLSGRRWRSVGWGGVRVRRWGLWPGRDTSDASAVWSGCWSPSAAAGPSARKDPRTPTSEGFGRSPDI